MNTIAFGISIYCAALLGSTMTYKWLAKQVTETQKKEFQKGWLVSSIGFGIFMLIVWRFPRFMGNWGLVLMPLLLTLDLWIKRMKTKRGSQPPNAD